MKAALAVLAVLALAAQAKACHYGMAGYGYSAYPSYATFYAPPTIVAPLAIQFQPAQQYAQPQQSYGQQQATITYSYSSPVFLAQYVQPTITSVYSYSPYPVASIYQPFALYGSYGQGYGQGYGHSSFGYSGRVVGNLRYR